MAKDVENMSLEEVKAELSKFNSPKFQNERIKENYQTIHPGLQAFAETQGGTITSAFRDPAYNEKVGGVPGSKHTKNLALDWLIDPKIQEAAKQRGLKTLVHDAGSGQHLHVEGIPDPSTMSLEEVKLALSKMGESQPSSVGSTQAPAQEKRQKIMGAPEASLRAAASAVPFSGTVSGALRTIPAFRAMAQVLGGNLEEAPKEYEKGFFGFDPSQFSRGRESFNIKEQQAAKEQPEAYTLTKLAAELPQYIAGAQALKAIPALSGSGILPAMGRGAISNVGVSQVHDFDPASMPAELITGLVGEPVARTVGAGLKGAGKLGQFLKFKQPGIGKQLQEYGFQWGAKGLQKANLAKSQELTQGLDEVFTKVGKDLPIEAPPSMNSKSIESVYRKFRAGAHATKDQALAAEMKGLIDVVESGQPIPLSSAQRLKGVIGKIAYDEKGLRKTQSAESFNTIYNDLKDQITNTIESVSPGSGQKYTVLNSQLEKTSKIGSLFKPQLTEGIEKGVGYKNKGWMEKILEGGAALGGAYSLPGVSIPAYAAYKTLQTTPVFTGLPVAGEAIKQTGPVLNPILNQIIQSLANQ